jgi:hypothetical protein
VWDAAAGEALGLCLECWQDGLQDEAAGGRVVLRKDQEREQRLVGSGRRRGVEEAEELAGLLEAPQGRLGGAPASEGRGELVLDEWRPLLLELVDDGGAGR